MGLDIYVKEYEDFEEAKMNADLYEQKTSALWDKFFPEEDSYDKATKEKKDEFNEERDKITKEMGFSDGEASAYTAKGDSDIERLKLSLDAKLAHIHKRLWKDFVPLQDGRFSVDGVVMTNEELTEFINKEMHVNDPNALNN